MPDEPSNSLFSAKDLLGAGAILTKLLETVSAGCGRFTAGVSRIADVYWLNNKEAENEAHRIRVVGAAQTETLQQRAQALAEVARQGNQQVESLDITGTEVKAHLTGMPPEVLALQERGASRAAYQNALQQLNLEATITAAAAALAVEPAVAAEPVRPDWSTRFFSIAQDISDEETQTLWGHILAGEIKQPGSFSLRTLEVLRNLAQEEAQLFKETASFAIRSRGVCMIARNRAGLSEEIINKYYSFPYENILTLIESGLILPDTHSIQVGTYSSELTKRVNYFRIADQVVFVEGEKDMAITCNVFAFTSAGNALYKLVAQDAQVSYPYLTDFTAPFRSQEARIMHGRVKEELPDGTFTYEEPLSELSD